MTLKPITAAIAVLAGTSTLAFADESAKLVVNGEIEMVTQTDGTRAR